MNRKLFAYLNIDHPMVAWEVAIGRIKSICSDGEAKFGVSLWFYSAIEKYIKNNSDIRVKNEFRLECVRQKLFPEKTSRLRGAYFFKSKYDAEYALVRWGLSHKKGYITEVYFSGNAFTEVDPEWITSYLKTDEQDWMPRYWSGEVLGEKPLLEVIASGIGVVQDRELRELAYKRIIDKWPTTSIFLNACMATFAEAKIENIGRSMPAILSKKEGGIEGSYFVSMKEFDENQDIVIESLQTAQANGMTLPFIRPKDQDKIFSLPDFREMGFTLNNKEVRTAFNLAHT